MLTFLQNIFQGRTKRFLALFFYLNILLHNFRLGILFIVTANADRLFVQEVLFQSVVPLDFHICQPLSLYNNLGRFLFLFLNRYIKWLYHIDGIMLLDDLGLEQGLWGLHHFCKVRRLIRDLVRSELPEHGAAGVPVVEGTLLEEWAGRRLGDFGSCCLAGGRSCTVQYLLLLILYYLIFLIQHLLHEFNLLAQLVFLVIGFLSCDLGFILPESVTIFAKDIC